MQVAGVPKGRKAANHCVFPMICGSGAGKIGPLAKAAGAETSGQMRDEKLNAACSDHFWKLRCRKSARRCGTKHISKSKVQRTDGFGPLLEVEMSKKCALLWHEAHVEVKSAKHWRSRTTFGRSDVVLHGRHNGLCTLLKVSNEGFAAVSKRMAGVGQVKRICKDAFRVAGAVQETDESDMLGGQGADFPERGCILKHRIFKFAKMILRDRCSTSCDLASFFWWQAQYFRQMEWKNRKTRWYKAVSSALNFPFLKEVSQNSFVFDVVNFENWGSLTNSFVSDVVKFNKWGSLAELLRFWCCQVQKLRKSRRIAAFWNLQMDRKMAK